MKILIVSSSDVIFRQIAKHLYEKISQKHDLVLARENVGVSLTKILKQRIKKAGIISGTSQFLFKVFDVLFLRKAVAKVAAEKLGNFDGHDLGSINSADSKEYISKFDFVIGIATSIIKQDILDAPTYGIINVHPGILPEYRGVGNFWAVMNEDWSNVGCTCHWMTHEIDVGKIICSTKIGPSFRTLWEMNYSAMLAGVNDLSKVINDGKVLEKNESIDHTKSNYYTWYGIADYMKFKKKLFSKMRDI